MNDRLFCTVASGKIRTPIAYANLLEEISVLYNIYWPAEISDSCGESEIKSLCQRLNLDVLVTLAAFQDYLDV